MTKVRVGVWHPKLSAQEIQSAVGMKADVEFSVGQPRQRGSGAIHRESYCLFTLDDLQATRTEADLAILIPFSSLVAAPSFKENGARVIVYFTAEEGELEIYTANSALKFLSSSGLEAVFRG